PPRGRRLCPAVGRICAAALTGDVVPESRAANVPARGTGLYPRGELVEPRDPQVATQRPSTSSGRVAFVVERRPSGRDDNVAPFPLRLCSGAVRGNQRLMRNDGKHSAALSLIKTAMIEKKLTQAELADAADCHEKTIQNLLSGRSVRDQTLFDVCMVLGLDFDKVKGAWNGGHGELRDAPENNGAHGKVAPVYMGAYSREAVDHYLGSYLTLRPSFSTPGGIMAYRTDIIWDENWPSLVFQERDRPDKPFLHRGRLYIPAS